MRDRPMLTRSEITGSVYVTTRYRALGNGEFDTFEKYDMTREFDAIADHIIEENETLRERHAQAVAEAEIWNAQWEAEHIENAKLRGLVREMLICESYLVSDAFDWYGCEGCPLHSGECNFEARAKELGIEVEPC